MYGLCMATKTISVDMEAYERLREARLDGSESFSKVIKRATWEAKSKSCGDLLSALPHLPKASKSVIRRLDAAQADDVPPDSHWS